MTPSRSNRRGQEVAEVQAGTEPLLDASLVSDAECRPGFGPDGSPIQRDAACVFLDQIQGSNRRLPRVSAADDERVIEYSDDRPANQTDDVRGRYWHNAGIGLKSFFVM